VPYAKPLIGGCSNATELLLPYCRRARLLGLHMRKLVIVLGSLAIVFAAVIAILFCNHRTAVELPLPTGRYGVGRVTYQWQNPNALVQLPPNPEALRDVEAWIWYPTVKSYVGQHTEYLPTKWREAFALSSGFVMSRLFSRDLELVRTHSFIDAPLANDVMSFPVVVLRSGGSALAVELTSLAEDLASHGYVVVGFDAPYRSVVTVGEDGRVTHRSPAASLEGEYSQALMAQAETLLPLWVQDAHFVVDKLDQLNESDPSGKFSGHLDLSKVAAVGHSFGGATALEFCYEDARCKAAIDLDGIPFGDVVKQGLKKPCAFLLTDHGDFNEAESKPVLAAIDSIYTRRTVGGELLYVKGTNHFSFTDQMLTKSEAVIAVIQSLSGGLDKHRGLSISSQFVHTYLDVYLKGEDPAKFDKFLGETLEIKPLKGTSIKQ